MTMQKVNQFMQKHYSDHNNGCGIRSAQQLENIMKYFSMQCFCVSYFLFLTLLYVFMYIVFEYILIYVYSASVSVIMTI